MLRWSKSQQKNVETKNISSANLPNLYCGATIFRGKRSFLCIINYPCCTTQYKYNITTRTIVRARPRVSVLPLLALSNFSRITSYMATVQVTHSNPLGQDKHLYSKFILSLLVSKMEGTSLREEDFSFKQIILKAKEPLEFIRKANDKRSVSTVLHYPT